MTTPVDLIVSARWLLPVEPADTVLENCSLVVTQGKILDILPNQEWPLRYTPQEHVELGNHVLMPGLINGHSHAAMTLLRGYADDLPLITWLEQHIWPAESRWVDTDFVRDGTELAIAEMLLTGTTCFSDMYFFPEVCAEVVHETGIRAQITFPICDAPTPWSNSADQAITQGLLLADNFRDHPRITIGFGPHAPYTVGDETFGRITTLASELEAPIQIHLHETQVEVDNAIAENGKRPIERLFDLGLLTPRTQCVHMTAVNSADIERIASCGAVIVHCPESNLKLASGFSPLQKFIEAGITIGLGTDGAASNNDLDLFGELKTAALLAKAVAGNAAALPAPQAIHLATLGGAKALGQEAIIGSLTKGKAADMIAVELNHLTYLPNYDVQSLLSYTGSGQRVSHSWVAGRKLVHEGQLTTINTQELISRIQQWGEAIGQNHR